MDLSFLYRLRPRFQLNQRIVTSGMSMADPHTENGDFGVGVEVGSLWIGWIVEVDRGVFVSRGEDVGRGVLDNVGVVGRRVLVGAGVLVCVGGYAKLNNTG